MNSHRPIWAAFFNTGITIHNFELFNDYQLLIAHCLLPIANCQLPIAYCLLPIAHCQLPIAHWFLRSTNVPYQRSMHTFCVSRQLTIW
jgi:hypothetical protein